MLFNGETGFVQHLEEKHVIIAFSEKDACDTCGLKVVCAPGKTSERSINLPNPGNLSLGQGVQLDEISNLELHLALVQFGFPMSLFLFGLGLGLFIPQHVIPRELMAFLVALLGLAGSFFIARFLVKQITTRIPVKYLRIRPVA